LCGNILATERKQGELAKTTIKHDVLQLDGLHLFKDATII
jgi:hypothetical protein